MSGNAKGEVTMQANDKTFRLHLGMSVLADLQERFGDRLEAILKAPEPDGPLPDLAVIHAVFSASLERYHGDVVDRWLVDDIIAQNEAAWIKLLQGSAPEPDETATGKRAGKTKAAAST